MSAPLKRTSMTTTASVVSPCNVEVPVVVELKMPPEQREVLRKDYTPSEYRIKHISMDFNLSRTDTEVLTDLYIFRADPKEGGPPVGVLCDLTLDGEDLVLLSPVCLKTDNVAVPTRKETSPEDLVGEGRPLDATKNEFKLLAGPQEGKLWINGSLLPSKPNVLFKVTTRVRVNPEKNTSLSGLFVSGTILCTQCEAEGFRRITFSVDRPDVLSTFKVRLRGDKSEFPVLLSNGNQIDEGLWPSDSRQRFVVFEDPYPKPTYLFAIVGGVLAFKEEHHKRPDGRSVIIRLWCEPREANQLDWAMETVKKAMVWDEKTFGLIYDLDWFNVVAVPSFNCGAMENKSLNIFNSRLLLASKDTSTDSNFLDIMRVVGHEYFHNWTGNRVTCRDWFQLTLKEGLTVFREQEFGADMGSSAVSRIEDVDILRSHQFPEDTGPLKHPIRPEKYIVMDNFYTSTVYEKGAEIIRLYQTLLGIEGFKKGLRLYFERHDGQAVTCDDFRAAMADANGVNLDQMEEWYLQAGTPEVKVDSILYEKDKERCKLKFSQSIPGNLTGNPLYIPLATGLIGKVSKLEIVPTTILHLREKSQEFVIDNVKEDFVVSLLRGFSAPIRLIHDVNDNDLAFLVANDTDPFNRYEAGQRLLKRIILHTASQVELIEGRPHLNHKIGLPQPLLEAFKNIMRTDIGDLEFKAALLTFPREELLRAEMDPCDPIIVRFALSYVKELFVQQAYGELMEILHTMNEAIAKIAEYKFNPEDVGKRRYRNVALAYLTAVHTASESEYASKAKLAYEHFQKANNMNDKFAAIQCLRHLPSNEREEAFNAFYEYTKDNENALNKWFAMQASSDISDIFDKLITLRQHPKFSDWTNPNRVNYRLFADAIIEFDKVNCKSAARMISEFSQWKRYTPERQSLILTEVQRIFSTPGLSPDCRELLAKTLQG